MGEDAAGVRRAAEPDRGRCARNPCRRPLGSPRTLPCETSNDRSRFSRFETRSGPEQAATASDRRRADLGGRRLSAANDFAVTPPSEKYLGADRFRVHLVGSVDPDGATHLEPSEVCNSWPSVAKMWPRRPALWVVRPRLHKLNRRASTVEQRAGKRTPDNGGQPGSTVEVGVRR
jgi:hypothetical protein